MKLGIYLIVTLLGMLSTRASLVAMRGGWASTNLLVAILGLVGSFGTIALLIWGFFQFAWYWPIIIFVVGSIMQGIMISRSNLPFWLMLAPVLDLVVLVGGAWLIWFAR